MKRFLAAIALFTGLAFAPAGAETLGDSVGNAGQAELLPADEAFVLGAERQADATIVLHWTIAEDYYLYRDRSEFRLIDGGDAELGKPRFSPSDTKQDPFFGEVEVFHNEGSVRLPLEGEPPPGARLEVTYQGCNDPVGVCYPPIDKSIDLGSIEPAAASADSSGSSGSGSADRSEQGRIAAALADRGLWLTVLVFIGFGLLLTLTPCVLPMIPVNLAIIGAGTRAGSRRSGFALGAVYGLAMALAYGALGLVVVLTGSTFGNINASPMFNFVAGGIFVLLALALFGVFNIDFRRLAGKLQPSSTGRSIYGAALFMGALSAILAGACVAPVVIAVLVIAVQAYDAGHFFGLLLPFVLGVGMALPWPFAGAGLSFLPRPGNWMRGVERAFGVIVLVLAGYFIYTGWGLYQAERKSATAERRQENVKDEGLDWSESMVKRLNKARKENRMVFIDFWAPWCKACHLMERTTFRDEDVRKELEKFILVKYQVHRDPGPFEKRVLDHFDVYGLPLYVVLRPES